MHEALLGLRDPRIPNAYILKKYGSDAVRKTIERQRLPPKWTQTHLEHPYARAAGATDPTWRIVDVVYNLSDWEAQPHSVRLFTVAMCMFIGLLGSCTLMWFIAGWLQKGSQRAFVYCHFRETAGAGNRGREVGTHSYQQTTAESIAKWSRGPKGRANALARLTMPVAYDNANGSYVFDMPITLALSVQCGEVKLDEVEEAEDQAAADDDMATDVAARRGRSTVGRVLKTVNTFKPHATKLLLRTSYADKMALEAVQNDSLRPERFSFMNILSDAIGNSLEYTREYREHGDDAIY